MDFKILQEKKLLLGVSGAISAVGISSYLLYFKNYFKEIRVIMTKNAADLIPSNTVSYFCDHVYSEDSETKKHNHVEIARWADVFCVLPATANTVGQVANGIALNLLTTSILAHPNPTIFFPSMNELMWEKKALNRNLDLLIQDGHMVIPPTTIMAYEVSSGSRKPNRVIVPPDKALNEILEILHMREEKHLVSKS